MTNIFTIRKQEDRLTPESRELLKEWVENLSNGDTEVRSNKVTRTYRGRYKFYWAYLLPEIINALNLSVSDKDDVYRPMLCDELHSYLKLQFNPVTIRSLSGTGWIRLPGSTTVLSDGDFIQSYEEKIAAHFISEHHIDLMSRDEWVQMMKERHNGIIENSKI